MGVMKKTLEQLWPSFYASVQAMEGVQVKGISVMPKVKIARLTHDDIKKHTGKRSGSNIEENVKKKRYLKRFNRISSDSDDSYTNEYSDIDTKNLSYSSSEDNSSLNEIFSDNSLPDLNPYPKNCSSKGKTNGPFLKVNTGATTSKSDKVDQQVLNKLQDPTENFKSFFQSLVQDEKTDTKKVNLSKIYESFSPSPKVSKTYALNDLTPSNDPEIDFALSKDEDLPSTSNSTKLNSSGQKNKTKLSSKSKKISKSIREDDRFDIELGKGNLSVIKQNSTEEKSLKRKDSQDSNKTSATINKLSQESILSYVDCEGPPVRKKIRLGDGAHTQRPKELKSRGKNKISQENEILSLLSKPLNSLIHLEKLKLDKDVMNMNAVQDVKSINAAVLNIVQSLKNHKEELEKERDKEIERLKRKYNNKFEEVDESIKKYTKLDDKLFDEIKNMRQYNSECSLGLKEEIKTLFSEINETKGTVDRNIDYQYEDHQEEILDSNLPKKNDLLDSSLKKSDVNTNKKHFKVIKNLAKQKPKNVTNSPAYSLSEKNASPLSSNNTIRSNDTVSIVKVSSSSSPIISVSQTATKSTEKSAASIIKIHSEQNKCSSPPVTISKVSKPSIRTIPEANVELFGSSVTKFNFETGATDKSTYSKSSIAGNTTPIISLSTASISPLPESVQAFIPDSQPGNKIPSITSTVPSTQQPSFSASSIVTPTALSPNTTGFDISSNIGTIRVSAKHHRLLPKPSTSNIATRVLSDGTQRNNTNQNNKKSSNDKMYKNSQLMQQFDPHKRNQHLLVPTQSILSNQGVQNLNQQPLIPHQSQHQVQNQNQQPLISPQSQHQVQNQNQQPLITHQSQHHVQHQNQQQLISYKSQHQVQHQNQQLLISHQSQHQNQQPLISHQLQHQIQYQNQQSLISHQSHQNQQPLITLSQLLVQHQNQQPSISHLSQPQAQHQNQQPSISHLSQTQVVQHQNQQPSISHLSQPQVQHQNQHPSISHLSQPQVVQHQNQQPSISHLSQTQVVQHQNQQPSISHLSQPQVQHQNQQPLITHRPQQHQQQQQKHSLFPRQTIRQIPSSTSQVNDLHNSPTLMIHQQQQKQVVPERFQASQIINPSFSQSINLQENQQQQQQKQKHQNKHQNKHQIQHHNQFQQEQELRRQSPVNIQPRITSTVSLAPGSSRNSEDIEDSSEQTCFLCGLPSTIICCGSYVYCSSECQNEDFERHKPECLERK